MTIRLPKTLALAAALAVTSLPALAHAETPHVHDGFYLRLALGLGYVHDSNTVSFGSSSSDLTISGVGGSGELLFGGTVAPGLVIGGGFQGGTFPKPKIKSGDRTFDATGSLVLSSIGPFVDYYLDPRGGLHFQGFLGFGSLSGQSEDGRTSSKAATGLALSVGVGHDWFVSDAWSIGVLGRLQYLNVSHSESGVKDAHSAVVPAVLATFTYH